MTIKEISSRAFAADPLKVKQMVKKATIIVTNRGKPELAIIPFDLYNIISTMLSSSSLEILSNKKISDIEFEIPKLNDISRFEKF